MKIEDFFRAVNSKIKENFNIIMEAINDIPVDWNLGVHLEPLVSPGEYKYLGNAIGMTTYVPIQLSDELKEHFVIESSADSKVRYIRAKSTKTKIVQFVRHLLDEINLMFLVCLDETGSKKFFLYTKMIENDEKHYIFSDVARDIRGLDQYIDSFALFQCEQIVQKMCQNDLLVLA